MQQTGTLRKRQRRILAKVNGLTVLPYDENENSFILTKSQKPSDSISTKNYTTLHMSTSELADARKNTGRVLSSRTRPTRNPMFHHNSQESFDVEDGQSRTEDAFHDSKEKKQCEQSPKIGTNYRPYLLGSHTLSRLKQILFLGMTSGTFPWKWDKSKHQIYNFSPKFSKGWEFFRALFAFQTCCITIFQVYIFWQTASSGNLTNREIFITSFSLMWYWEWIDYALNMYIYGERIREYINTLLKFNFDMVTKYVIDLDGHKDGGRICMDFTTLGSFWSVLIKVMYFLRMPFAPWYLFSYISPKPWYWLIPGAIHAFLFSGQVMASHTLVCWLVAAHANTTQFWLKEIHNNNNSDYTSDELRKRKASLEVFKSLQVLNNCFNDCVSPLYIPAIKAHTGVVAIVSGYVMIRSMDGLFIQEFPQSLIYPMGFFICTTEAFVVLNMSSQMFDLSISMIDSWSLTKDKDFRRTLLSFSTLRIRVRNFYFITVSTTITFFKILWDNITNVLLSFV